MIATHHQRRLRAMAPLRILILFSAFVFVLGLSLPAFAQQVEDQWKDGYYPYSREGVYVGFGALVAVENFDRDTAVHGTGSSQNVDGKDAGGPQVRFGYRYSPRIAGEVLFQYYAGFNLSDDAAGVDDNFDGWSMTLNGKLYAFLGRVQPYGLFGMGGIAFDKKRGDDAAFLARLGGGIDFYLTDHVVIDFEAAYAMPAGSLDDLQFATFGLGIQYRY
jgi:hypothetical protein